MNQTTNDYNNSHIFYCKWNRLYATKSVIDILVNVLAQYNNFQQIKQRFNLWVIQYNKIRNKYNIATENIANRKYDLWYDIILEIFNTFFYYLKTMQKKGWNIGKYSIKKDAKYINI